MEVILGIPFRYEQNEVVKEVLEDFKDMINFCIDYAYSRRITSYAKLRRGVYDEWKKRWNYSTHFCHSACKIALAILKNHRRKRREGKPEAKKLFMQLDPQLYKFYGDRIRISIRPREFIFINLKFGEYQQEFIKAWREGKLKTGELTINKHKVIIPFKKEVDLTDPSDWMAIDMNESNVTAASTNSCILRIYTRLRTIHTTYFEIRRRIQKLSKFKPIKAKNLLAKYSDRERHRTMDECHKIAKKIVDFAKEHRMGIIMEDLKGIRRNINYNKNLNRRLHSWNFRKLQFYIDYKTRMEGLPVIYVDPRGTSSLCPKCGCKLEPNRHRLMKCRKCGYENDRDIVACLNMLRMRGVPLPPKALNEPLIIEVRGKG